MKRLSFKTRNFQNVNTILTLVLTVFSLIALILSWISFSNSTRITEQVNSKEYQMSEDLKYEMLKVVADLKSIDSKASLEHLVKNKRAYYSIEIEDLTKLRTSPGYLFYLNSIESDETRFWLEYNMVMLITSINYMGSWQIRDCVYEALKILKNVDGLDNTFKTNVWDLMGESCDLTIINQFEPQKNKELTEDELYFYSFVDYLYKELKVKDSIVMFYYGKHYDSTEIMQEAISMGAYVYADPYDVLNRYQKEFVAFRKMHPRPNKTQ